jgi:4-hydroxybenzoate polyprenyltransferase
MKNTPFSFFLDFLQVSRPGWWLVTTWLYLAPSRSDEVIDVAGLLFVLLPLNALVYGMNDAADLDVDISSDRKGNFIFGPKGWSKDRLFRVLIPALIMTFLPLVYWGLTSKLLVPYLTWFILAITVNYYYNFRSFSWKLLLVFVGYGSVTLLSFWRHGGNGLGLYKLESGVWYFAGCNEDYWVHLTLLLVRSQLWTELLDYETDRRHEKWTTLSRFRTKSMAQFVVLTALLLEAAWCLFQYLYHGSDWLVLLSFSAMGVLLFVSLEYALPLTKDLPTVDLIWLSLMQNAGGLFLLYDCWSRGIFVK